MPPLGIPALGTFATMYLHSAAVAEFSSRSRRGEKKTKRKTKKNKKKRSTRSLARSARFGIAVNKRDVTSGTDIRWLIAPASETSYQLEFRSTPPPPPPRPRPAPGTVSSDRKTIEARQRPARSRRDRDSPILRSGQHAARGFRASSARPSPSGTFNRS